ncbi:MAG: hypothetical protein U9N35_05280 [Euryarchaeota archaeon]|nr:hypothetical protein [Euryarchaeota archaeon]
MSLIVVGVPGTGKRLWLKRLLEERVLYVAVDIPPEDVDYGGIVVDCYSERIGSSDEEYHVTCAYDLDEIYKEITGAMESFTGSSLVMDSLTPLLLTLEIHSVYRFLQKLLAYSRVKGIDVFSILHRTHGETEERSILHLFDDALHLEKINNGSMIEYYYHKRYDSRKKRYYIKEGEIVE